MWTAKHPLFFITLLTLYLPLFGKEKPTTKAYTTLATTEGENFSPLKAKKQRKKKQKYLTYVKPICALVAALALQPFILYLTKKSKDYLQSWREKRASLKVPTQAINHKENRTQHSLVEQGKDNSTENSLVGQEKDNPTQHSLVEQEVETCPKCTFTKGTCTSSKQCERLQRILQKARREGYKEGIKKGLISVFTFGLL